MRGEQYGWGMEEWRPETSETRLPEMGDRGGLLTGGFGGRD